MDNLYLDNVKFSLLNTPPTQKPYLKINDKYLSLCVMQTTKIGIAILNGSSHQILCPYIHQQYLYIIDNQGDCLEYNLKNGMQTYNYGGNGYSNYYPANNCSYIIFAQNNLNKLDYNKNTIWTYSFSNYTNGWTTNDNKIYLITSNSISLMKGSNGNLNIQKTQNFNENLSCLISDSENNLYLFFNNSVKKFTPENLFENKPIWQYDKPCLGMNIDSNNNLYCVENNSIIKFNSAGKIIKVFNNLQNYNAIAIDDEENFYLGVNNNSDFCKYSNGKIIYTTNTQYYPNMYMYVGY